jgi:hypothetical protein
MVQRLAKRGNVMDELIAALEAERARAEQAADDLRAANGELSVERAKRP